MAQPADGFKEEAHVLRALSHPVRLRILDILAPQEACVCHLAATLRVRQSYFWQRLAMRCDTSLVTDRRSPRRTADP